MNIPQITFTRFIAAFSVVIYHYGREIFPFNLPFINQVFSIANIGVSYFFLLSGFILAIVYFEKEEKQEIKRYNFYILRIARIYPLYLLSLLLVLLLRYYANSNWEILRTTPSLVHFSLLQSWFPQYTMKWNFPAWSLSVELFFYLIFPFAIRFLMKFSNSIICLLVIVFWLLNLSIFIFYIEQVEISNNSLLKTFVFFSPVFHLNTFIFGVGTGIIFKRMHKHLSSRIASLFLILSTTLFFILVFIPNGLLKYYHNGMMAPVFALLLVGLASNQSLLVKVFAMRFPEILGEISYGVYILQEPVKIVFFKYFNISTFTNDNSLLFYSYLLALTLISLISFYLIEKPIRNFVKSKLIPPIKKISVNPIK